MLLAGRLGPNNGVDILVRALSPTSARAVIVGEGPIRGRLERRARDTGAADRVHFAGAVSDPELAALYHACDLFVLPSVTRAEAFGMVQIEAMACGKPVVSTAVPSGVPWVNQHGCTGLVVPPGDPGALAAAIESLAADPSLRQRMGDAGRRRVAAEFTADRMAQRTLAVYHDVLDGHAA